MPDPGPSQGSSGWKAPPTAPSSMCHLGPQRPPARGWGARSPEGGRGQGGPGPASLPACEPHSCPSPPPCQHKHPSQTKSLFLLVLNPQSLPSPPPAKIKTSDGRACSLERMEGRHQRRRGPAILQAWTAQVPKGTHTSCFVQGTKRAEAEVRQASRIPSESVCIPGCVMGGGRAGRVQPGGASSISSPGQGEG